MLYGDCNNIFESAQKFSGHKKKFINGMDYQFRIDVGKLVSNAACGREIQTGRLYGFELPVLDTGKYHYILVHKLLAS